MDRTSSLQLGLKALGIYFAASAVVDLAHIILTYAMIISQGVLGGMPSDVPDGAIGTPLVVAHTIQVDHYSPIVFGVAAYLLLKRTDWCWRLLRQGQRPAQPHGAA